MKKIIMSLLAISIVLAVKAQEIPDRKSDMHGGMHKKGMKKGHPGMGLKNLDLSVDQKSKLKAERENMKKEMYELKQNENITVKEYKTRMEGIHKGFKDKMAGILTTEQKAQIEKNKQDAKEKQKVSGEKKAAMMKEKLGLTDEQSAKMKQNHETLMAKMKTIREDKNLSEEKKKEAIKEAMKAQKEKTKSILTEEQLNKMKEERKEGGMKKRMEKKETK